MKTLVPEDITDYRLRLDATNDPIEYHHIAAEFIGRLLRDREEVRLLREALEEMVVAVERGRAGAEVLNAARDALAGHQREAAE